MKHIILLALLISNIFASELLVIDNINNSSSIEDGLLINGNQIIVLQNGIGNNQNSELIILDRNDNIIKDLTFDNGRFNSPKLAPTHDAGFILSVHDDPNRSGNNVTLSKFDSSFELISQFKFGIDNQWRGMTYEDDYLYHVGNTQSAGGTVLFRLNNDFEIDKSIAIPDFHRDGAFKIAVSNDLIVFNNKINGDFHQGLSFFDKNFNHINTVNIPLSGNISSLIEYKNNFVLAISPSNSSYIELLVFNNQSLLLHNSRIDLKNTIGNDYRLVNNNGNLYLLGTLQLNQKSKIFSMMFNENFEVSEYYISELNNILNPLNIKNTNDVFALYNGNISKISDFFSESNCYMSLSDDYFENELDISIVNRTNVGIVDYGQRSNFQLNMIENPNRNSQILTCPGAECDLEFSYPNFAEIVKLNFVGDALIFEDNARLTNSLPFETGALWHTDPIPVTNKFFTEFSFKFSNGDQGSTSENSLPGADGIAFVFQSRSPQNIGKTAGEIGYGNIFQSLAIEIDLYENSQFGDPNGNHVAVQRVPFSHNSPRHNDENTLAINSDIIEILADNTNKYYSKIEYENRVLQVFIDDNGLFEEPVIVLEDFDFSDHFELLPGDKAFVGFTSATGNAYQTQEILTWELCAYDNEVDTKVEYYNKEITLYPNPVVDELLISDNLVFDYFIIRDSLGNLIIKSELYKVNLDNVSNGIYFIEFLRNNKKIHASKFIITK